MDATLTRDETQRLNELRAKLRGELADMELAGLEERAKVIRTELDAIGKRLDAALEADHARQRGEWDEEARQREARESRERHESEQAKAAETFLTGLLAGGAIVARDEAIRQAEAKGIPAAAVTQAAASLGAATVAQYGRNGRTWKGTPRHWTLTPFHTGYGRVSS